MADELSFNGPDCGCDCNPPCDDGPVIAGYAQLSKVGSAPFAMPAGLRLTNHKYIAPGWCEFRDHFPTPIGSGFTAKVYTSETSFYTRTIKSLAAWRTWVLANDFDGLSWMRLADDHTLYTTHTPVDEVGPTVEPHYTTGGSGADATIILNGFWRGGGTRDFEVGDMVYVCTPNKDFSDDLWAFRLYKCVTAVAAFAGNPMTDSHFTPWTLASAAGFWRTIAAVRVGHLNGTWARCKGPLADATPVGARGLAAGEIVSTQVNISGTTRVLYYRALRDFVALTAVTQATLSDATQFESLGWDGQGSAIIERGMFETRNTPALTLYTAAECANAVNLPKLPLPTRYRKFSENTDYEVTLQGGGTASAARHAAFQWDSKEWFATGSYVVGNDVLPTPPAAPAVAGGPVYKIAEYWDPFQNFGAPQWPDDYAFRTQQSGWTSAPALTNDQWQPGQQYQEVREIWACPSTWRSSPPGFHYDRCTLKESTTAVHTFTQAVYWPGPYEVFGVAGGVGQPNVGAYVTSAPGDVVTIAMEKFNVPQPAPTIPVVGGANGVSNSAVMFCDFAITSTDVKVAFRTKSDWWAMRFYVNGVLSGTGRVWHYIGTVRQEFAVEDENTDAQMITALIAAVNAAMTPGIAGVTGGNAWNDIIQDNTFPGGMHLGPEGLFRGNKAQYTFRHDFCVRTVGCSSVIACAQGHATCTEPLVWTSPDPAPAPPTQTRWTANCKCV